LVAGQRYYVEALHKENTGGDNLIVGWRTPAMGANATPVVVPGAVLSPYILSNARQTWLDEPELKPTMNVLTASPNPFSQNLVISFTSSETGKAECDLYDLKGVNVQQLYKGKVTAGEQTELHLDGQSLKEGMYLIRMRTETQSTHLKVVLVR
jgi:endoglucanase